MSLPNLTGSNSIMPISEGPSVMEQLPPLKEPLINIKLTEYIISYLQRTIPVLTVDVGDIGKAAVPETLSPPPPPLDPHPPLSSAPTGGRRRSVKKKSITEPQPIMDSSEKPVRRGSDGTPYVYAKGAIVPKAICRKIIEYAIDEKLKRLKALADDMLPSLSESKIGKIKIMMMQYKNVAEREETVDVFDNQYENEVLAISSQAKSSEETKSQLKARIASLLRAEQKMVADMERRERETQKKLLIIAAKEESRRGIEESLLTIKMQAEEYANRTKERRAESQRKREEYNRRMASLRITFASDKEKVRLLLKDKERDHIESLRSRKNSLIKDHELKIKKLQKGIRRKLRAVGEAKKMKVAELKEIHQLHKREITDLQKEEVKIIARLKHFKIMTKEHTVAMESLSTVRPDLLTKTLQSNKHA